MITELPDDAEELRLWLTPEQKERVLKYVARFKRDV